MPLRHLSDIAKKIIYYERGRDALWSALGLLGLTPGEVILVPAYLCPAVLQPLKKRGLRVRFYRVQKDLSADLTDLAGKICPRTKAVLIIHYFGFPQPVSSIDRLCREHKLFLIEDCAHVLSSAVEGRPLGSFGDAAVFSFKKTLKSLPGRGAALLINRPTPACRESAERQPVSSGANAERPQNFYPGLKNFILQYKTPRFLIDRIIRLTDFLRLNPRRRIKADYLERMKKSDLDAIVAECRKNFTLLLGNLKGRQDLVPVFPALPEQVCPLGFPVFVENRDAVFRKLLNSGIEPFILWEFLPGEVSGCEFKDADYISRHILIFPVAGFINIRKICNGLSN